MLKEILKFLLFIVFICLTTILIYFYMSADSKTYKYLIVDSNNREYRALSYEKIGDCIKFNSSCTNEVIEICGTYQIKENKKYTNQ